MDPRYDQMRKAQGITDDKIRDYLAFVHGNSKELAFLEVDDAHKAVLLKDNLAPTVKRALSKESESGSKMQLKWVEHLDRSMRIKHRRQTKRAKQQNRDEGVAEEDKQSRYLLRIRM